MIVGESISSLNLTDCWTMVCSHSLRHARFTYTNESDHFPRPTVADILQFIRLNESARLRSLILSNVMAHLGLSLPTGVTILRSLEKLELMEDAPCAAAFIRQVKFPFADAHLQIGFREGIEQCKADARQVGEALSALNELFKLLLPR